MRRWCRRWKQILTTQWQTSCTCAACTPARKLGCHFKASLQSNLTKTAKSTLLPVMSRTCSLALNVWRTPGILLSETPIFQDFLPRCCTVLCLLTVTTHTHDFEDKEFCSAIGKKKGLRLWIFKFHLIIDEWRYHCDLVRSNMTLASIYNRNFMV